MKRILLAGLLGGVAFFAWESVARMLTPLGEMGFKTLPDEAATLQTLKSTIQDSGLYAFPAPQYQPGMTSDQRREAMSQAMAKYQTGPSGMVLIMRHGAPAMEARQLLTQLACDIVAMLMAAFLLAQIPSASFGSSALLVLLMALFSTLRSDIPQWNWYHFPLHLIAGEFIVNIVGFALGALILAWLVHGRPKTTAAAS